MRMFKWVWIVILSAFLVTAGLPSVCLAKEAPTKIRTFKLANGGMLKQIKQNNRLIWTSLDKSGKRNIAHGDYKLQNGKVIKFNRGAYIKSKSTLPTGPNTSASLLSTKVALQNSLNNLQRAYSRFLRNPNDIKTRGFFNNALDNATADANRLAKKSKSQDPQLARTPQRPSTGGPLPPMDKQPGRLVTSKRNVIAFKGNVPIRQEDHEGPPPPPPIPPEDPDPETPPQGPQGGITKGEMTRLLNMANSLLGDFSNVRNISRMQTKMNTRSINILSSKMKGIQGKGRDLVLLEPRAEP